MMSRTGRYKALLLMVAVVLGGMATKGSSQHIEYLPAPVPATVHVDGPHVVHGACCVQTCGHCSPEAHHRYRPSARRALKCGSVELCMHVVNPACCGCPVEIPMCVPACCAAEPPVVKNDRGLFGRGVVCIEWPCCGYSARVVFKHSGHIHVVYTGH